MRIKMFYLTILERAFVYNCFHAVIITLTCFVWISVKLGAQGMGKLSVNCDTLPWHATAVGIFYYIIIPTSVLCQATRQVDGILQNRFHRVGRLPALEMAFDW